FALEFWSAVLIFRGSLSDIYDLNWSKCGKYILSGSVDNTSRVWDVSNGTCLSTQSDHTHYVQGVCWDPLEEFFISQSSDRSTKVYYYQSSKPIEQAKLVASHSRISVSTTKKSTQNTNLDDKEKEELEDFQPNTNITTTKSINLYQSEALISFFRRPCFTPDGSLLLTAAGIGLKGSSDYCVHIYPRCSLLSSPPLRLSGFKSPVIAISCSPKLYPLIADKPSQFDLPYRMVIACATQNEVLIYDTQSSEPIASVKKIHYKTLTDISWSQDGQYLIVTSSDGYCTLVQFDEHELEGTTEEVKLMSLEEARDRLRGSNTRIVGIEKFQQEMKKRPRSKADSMSSPIKSIPSAKLDAEANDSKPQESSTPKKRRIVPILVTEEPQTTSTGNTASDKTETGDKTNKTEETKQKENNTPKKRRIVPTLVTEDI
ncbi:WD40 repeat-like protein, partial [Conidiobolus coronatus NRRL 28638]